ncbi:unnamed protein product [Prorocentrum cordatum]|uniref:Cyclic nucleotide-binding domain-containing protein n=1 Tax=Prorocentrum cordatum TaxID=2364126 RepID=A0ABN9SBB3_9DINO|nr:unnamed protein product [Polarella glacialis]
MQGHRKEMETLSAFLHRMDVCPDVRMQVSKQVKVKLMQRRPEAVKDMAVLDKLSLSLRHSLQLELCNPHFLEHPLLNFLSNEDTAMWEEVCMACAHFSVLVKGDNLFVFGAEAEGMYFVVRGPLSYELDASFPTQLSEHVMPGAWLSEAALWCHWRHMGCAESPGLKGAACCEVLLLRTAALIPILTRRGLIGQLAWAYALSFHHFLQECGRLLDDWPNDLVLPFGADEVIAAMPRDAKAVVGQGAIEVLRSPQDSLLASWLSEDNIQKLASEAQAGGSALFVTASRGRVRVVRCVPLVMLRIKRQDKRVFVRMRLVTRADGGQEATCKLPGGRPEAGEHPDGYLQRLLERKLKALADGIEVVRVERQSEQDNSRKFGVPTRYVHTVVSAVWHEPEGDGDASGSRPPSCRSLDQFQAPRVDLADLVLVRRVSTRSRDVDIRAKTQRARQKPVEMLSFPDPEEVYMFPGDASFYAWLTEDQFAYLKDRQGQSTLFLWLLELYRRVGVESGRPGTPAPDESSAEWAGPEDGGARVSEASSEGPNAGALWGSEHGRAPITDVL